MTDKGTARTHWKRVGLFLGLTFGLTWLLDLLVWLTVGYSPRALTALQLQMLIPAFCAIVLGMYVFKDGPIYQVRVRRERPLAFLTFYLAYTALSAVAGLAPLFFEQPAVLTVASIGAQGLALIGLIVLVVVRLVSGREAWERAGLSGGPWAYWLLFGAGLIALYAAQAALNAAFGLGEAIDPALLLAQLPPEQAAAMSPMLLLVLVGIQAVVLGPFLGLLMGFGEEFGWRGYLQSELIVLGKVKGTLLLGVIWGIWHAPVIAMGHNYPGYPLAGIGVMTGYTVGLGFILGYVMLRSGSVLLASWLHALNNQVWSFLVLVVYRPADPIFSFGAGLYGLIILALVGALLLLDPVWRDPRPKAMG